MTEEIRQLGLTVLGSTIVTLVGFVVYRVLRPHRGVLYDRFVSVRQLITSLLDKIGRRLANREARRKFTKMTIVLGLPLVVVYFTPILVSSSKSQPLYGNFDMGMKCMGGHEIFLYLEEDSAFQHCPGHRDMSLMGPVTRSTNSATIHLNRSGTPWWRVDLNDSDYALVFLDDSSTHELSQVNNPWRTWLPRILPEL